MNQDPSSLVMDDFIFGGIEADESLRLAQVRARWSGIRHLHTLEPVDPQPGQPVRITAWVGPDVQVDRMTLYWTADGSDPAGQRAVATNGTALALRRVEVRWEALLWDYVECWQGEIPAQAEWTLVQYRIEGWCSYDATPSIWSRETNLEKVAELPTRYAYHVDHFAAPQWAKAAVIYQIMVDRFARGEAQAASTPPLHFPQRWLEPAELNDFIGGNLAGVVGKLDYLVGLGVTVLWLSPIFKTTTYHGYDAVDFFTVDARFGSNDDLRQLVQAAHARGLRVILDFVANHVSNRFAPFLAAQRDPASPYRNWFSFDPVHKHGYRAFFDEPSMPQINTDHPAARRYLIEAACFWLAEYDIDGYRLDYAAGPGLAFWSEFRAACRQVQPDCWLIGEVTLAGDDLHAYAGRLDGCLDFAFCRLVRQLCTGSQAAISIGQFANTLMRSRHFFGATGAQTDFLLPSFIDNHDMNRFLWLVSNDAQRLRLAAGLLFALGGPPIVYYGTEIGLSQPRHKGHWREEARHPMRWDAAQDQSLYAHFKQWIGLRRRHPALQEGDLITRQLDDETGVWLVERQHGADRVLIAVNISPQAQPLHLPIGQYITHDGETVQKTMLLPPRQVKLLTPIASRARATHWAENDAKPM